MLIVYLSCLVLPLFSVTSNKRATYINCGRAVPQAVSRLLIAEAARVRAQVESCGICGGLGGTGAGFLRVLQFSLPLIPQTTTHLSSFIFRGCYNWANCGRLAKWIQSHHALRILKTLLCRYFTATALSGIQSWSSYFCTQCYSS
jgi:hypothetical protein